MAWKSENGEGPTGCEHLFVKEPHFVVFKMSSLLKHEGWKVHAQITRAQKEKGST